MQNCKRQGFKKFVSEVGRVPKMKGFPKIHKKEVKLRPVLDCRGNMLEGLEKKIKRIAEKIREVQDSRRVLNSG